MKESLLDKHTLAISVQPSCLFQLCGEGQSSMIFGKSIYECSCINNSVVYNHAFVFT